MSIEYFSVNRYPGDGVTTVWDISFAGGYIDREHVKAFILDADGVQTDIPITDAMFVTPFRIDLGVAAPVGGEAVLFRDTPKDVPLVDFQRRSRLTEGNLDKVAHQAVFGVAEIFDAATAAGVVVAEVVTAGTAAALARDAAQAAEAGAVVARTGAEAARTQAQAAATAAQTAEANVNATITDAIAAATVAAVTAATASATASASAASTSAGNAANSASEAAASAVAATTQAGIATTQAGNSAGSAASATASAASASASASAAATSAGNAAASATSAAASAARAAASAASINPADLVSLTGDQTIAGTKTFSNEIVASGGVRGTVRSNTITDAAGTGAPNFPNGLTVAGQSPVTTTSVLNATAGASVGAVGTYAFLASANPTTVNAGGTKAGSNLRYAGLRTEAPSFQGTATAVISDTPAGTWRCMGFDFSTNDLPRRGGTLWLRIS